MVVKKPHPARQPLAGPARLGVILLLTLGASIRVAHLLELRADPFVDRPIMDAEYHDLWARSIAAGKPFVSEVFFRAPLYPYLLAAVYRLFGPEPWAPRVLQAALGVLSLWLLFRIARRLLGDRAAILALLIGALYDLTPYYEAELLLPALLIFLCVASMERFLACLEAGSARSALLSGGLFGLAAIVRPNALVVVPGLALFLAARAGARRRAAALAFTAATLVFPLAVTAVNWIRGGDLVFIASQSGVNLYIGNNRSSNGWSAVAPGLRPDWWGGYQDMIHIPEHEKGRALKPSEVSAYWTRRAIREIAQDPVWWLGHMVRKTYLWFGAEELSNNKDLAFWKTQFPVIQWLPVLYGVLAPLAILGALLVPWRQASPLVLFVLPYAASFVLFFVTSRYRLTTVPFLAVLAAGALDRLAGLARRGAWRPFAGWTAALVALTAFLSAGLAPVAQPTFALSYMEIGRREMERQSWGAAEAAFRRALGYEPGNLDARHDLGIALREGGQPDSALAHLTAVARARDDARTWNNVGLTLWAMGRRGEAREAFRNATAREARDPDAWLNLAVLTEEEGDWAAALELLERGAALRGEDAMVWYHRAFILSRLGRIQEARAAVAACLRLAPGLADARTLSSQLESVEPDTTDPGKQRSASDTSAARPGL